MTDQGLAPKGSRLAAAQLDHGVLSKASSSITQLQRLTGIYFQRVTNAQVKKQLMYALLKAIRLSQKKWKRTTPPGTHQIEPGVTSITT